jgi:hypothetical protein
LKGRTKHEEHVPHCSTPNLIPTPYMQQREKEKEKERKETSTPNVNKNTRLSLTTKQRTLIYAQKNRSTRKGNNQTKKTIPPNYKHI